MPNLPEFYQWLQSNPANNQNLDWQQFTGNDYLLPGIERNNHYERPTRI
ncbi:MAG: hypothetical protein MRERV_7c067 [Mycoplasmataceae bacterium RV_VA103A]|nr:MAG: hypothetical protein MRERV_7c067 [Mycoplasmataceae bacterium RV_VA103A]